ncbi:IS1182 family transposase, partial [Bradyrhizobium sp. Leo170]|uniref:IS1182 family transposase n=1 Tax=Bradyrhizobium sp. Leo170 TaxID=1571199 RepID=UPI00102E5EFC
MVNRLYKTGVDRDQLSLLPARIEDYVGPDNPVRAIEAYVCTLDLERLGFRHSRGGGGAGQPSYDPADLLKLYLYGYLNRVRSSRRLEQEAGRNLELMWLLKGLVPGYRTIANFRKENWAALKAANREFVVLARALSLLGGELVAIDGAFFHGDAGKGSIKTRKRLTEQLAAIERDIEAYGEALEANDATEAKPSCDGGDGGKGDGGGIADKFTALMERRAQAKADLTELERSGQTQLSTTDADARLLAKSGQRVAGYNVQIAVDAKHKLIVASDVVNDGNDSGQLHPTAMAAKEVLGVETLQALADTGYYNGAQLKACEDAGIVAYVPQAKRTDRLTAQGRFSHEEFSYVADADAYRCPAGELLTPTPSLKTNGSRLESRYVSRKAVCDGCSLRGRCVEKGSQTRTIYRWVHEDVIERHQARMRNADSPMRRRSSLVEHPFGTLKCRAGYRHFLVRGLDKVRGEWSLMALCYNFSRLLSILGFDGFIACLASRQASSLAAICILRAVAAIAGLA